MRANKGVAVIGIMAGVAAWSAVFDTACTPAQVATVGIDLTNAVCTVLSNDLQNEPGWIKYACNLINPISQVVTVVAVKVPVAQKASFEAAHKVVASDGGR